MPAFELIAHSPCSPEITFAFITDLSRWDSFRGSGPLPGIVRASLDGTSMGPGARVRVENTDGSVHHENFVDFVPGKGLQIRMELSPPASFVLAGIDEQVELSAEGEGCRIRRRFVLRPRWFFLWPMAWVLCNVFLKRAVDAHNREVVGLLSKTE